MRLLICINSSEGVNMCESGLQENVYRNKCESSIEQRLH